MAQEVISVKTVGNEEVIACVVDEQDDHYVLSMPRALMLQQSADGSVGMGMLPFMASANNHESGTESDVILYKKDILSRVVNVPEPMTKFYLKSVSTIELI